eukprot:804185_1
MAFRKRKKKSGGPRFKVTHNANGSNSTEIAHATPPMSLSFESEQHNENNNHNSARIDFSDQQKEKQRRKKRKKRIKATQRQFQTRTRCNDKTNTTESIYTNDYLNTLKQQNRQMAVPSHIKQQIQEQNEQTQDINMIDNNNADNPIEIEDNDSDDQIMKAKILTSKLKRRTKALINVVHAHAQNKPSHATNDDPLRDFIPLTQCKNGTQKQQTHSNEIDLTHSADEDLDAFELQQIQKAGITFKKQRESKARKAHKGWTQNDNPITLEEVNELIDADINGTHNRVKPPKGSYHRSYEEVQAEYVAADKNLTFNNKQQKAINEKHSFFETLQNESIAYLNCLSEKTEIIDKYVSMNLYLREQRQILLAKERCLNEVEAYQQAFDAKDYNKDIKVANAYQTLDDLNETETAEVSDMCMNIWNKTDQTLDERQYLLHKKRRHLYREQKMLNTCPNQWYLNVQSEGYFFKKREQIWKELKTIFEDIRVEYRSFNGMCKILDEWKRKYRKEYDNAFVSISIPKLIAPFVRLELMQWNALKHRINICRESDDQSTIVSTPQLFICCKWYQLMSMYGTDENGEMNADDPDDMIVPTLVAALVVPELIHIVEFDWDPYSKQETKQLMLQIDCALEHLAGYTQFDAKKNALRKAIRDRCDAAVCDLIELKCIPSGLIAKIVSNFKGLPRKPLDGVDVNKSNLPNGAMYRYVKQRVFAALELVECVLIVMDSMEYCVEMIGNVYKSVIEGFITYLARCPSRNAKNEMKLQVILLDDLSAIVQRVCAIKHQWKSRQTDANETDDDDDMQMNDNTCSNDIIMFPQPIIKHIKRSIVEMCGNIDDGLKTNSDVVTNLNCLNGLLSLS